MTLFCIDIINGRCISQGQLASQPRILYNTAADSSQSSPATAVNQHFKPAIQRGLVKNRLTELQCEFKKVAP